MIVQKILKKKKKHPKSLQEQVSEYSKIAGTRLIHKIAFLHTSNEQMGFEIKNTIPFTLVPKKMQYLGINLTKHTYNLYEEKYKTLMNKIKELNK